MAYHVQSALSLSLNDNHSYFIYYVPGEAYAKTWIDEWIEHRFLEIASKIGPKGVLVAPTPNNGNNFLKEIKHAIGASKVSHILDLTDRISKGEKHSQALHFSNTTLTENSKKNDGLKVFWRLPMLIFSHTPLQESGANEGYVINLAACQTTEELGIIMDTLVDIIKSDDVSLLNRLQFYRDKPKNNYFQIGNKLLDVIDLKPNIMGLGVNLNEAFRIMAIYYKEKNMYSRFNTLKNQLSVRISNFSFRSKKMKL